MINMSSIVDKIKVIVIGGNHHNTLGVLRSLGEKGLFPELILVTSCKRPYVKYSRYIYDYCQLSKWDDVLLELENRKCRYNGLKPVIISCADLATYYLDSNYDELVDYYCLPLGRSQGEISKAMDKMEMKRMAEKVELNVPYTYSLDELKLGMVEFPIIIKPLSSIEGSKSDIKIVKSAYELSEYMCLYKDKHLIAQNFIDKQVEFQFIGCSLDKENIIIPGVSIILRQPKETNTGYLKYVPFSEFSENGLLQRCISFIREIGYTGLFSMEFLRDKCGNDYFMEINFRNDGNSICVTEAGVNLPYIWYAYNSCLEYKEEIQKPIHSVYVMPEFSDLKVAMRLYNKSIFNWIDDVRKTNRFMEYDSKDKKPFLVGLYQELHSVFCYKLFKHFRR